MGKPAKLRSEAVAIDVYRLREMGYTARAIAKATGINPDQVKARALLGERILAAREPTKALEG